MKKHLGLLLLSSLVFIECPAASAVTSAQGRSDNKPAGDSDVLSKVKVDDLSFVNIDLGSALSQIESIAKNQGFSVDFIVKVRDSKLLKQPVNLTVRGDFSLKSYLRWLSARAEFNYEIKGNTIHVFPK